MAEPTVKEVRVRIAPSPTGQDIHIGNLYTALLNFAFAKKHHGKFVIRIEDTDRTRFQEGSEQRILSSLKAFGLTHDEGPDIGGPYKPYKQSERLDLYKKYAEELVENEAAYYCFCTRERLDEIRKKQIEEKKTPKYDKHCLIHEKNVKERIGKGESHVIRLNIVPNKQIIFEDVIRGDISISSNEVDDQVLLKSDGYPTYHLGVVVDDHEMNITHIIRAEEWISSTPKHILLYKSFRWSLPVFAHVPILRNPDKSKLSKRKNPVWASWYLEQGYLPEAVLNYLALMGWSHPEQKEIFPLSEFIQLFDLKDIHPVGPVFDLKKLTWLNQQYIQNLSDSELLLRLQNHFEILKGYDPATLKSLIPLLKTRMSTLNDFRTLTNYFFEEPTNTLDEKEKIIANDLLDNLKNIPNWNQEELLTLLKSTMEKNAIRMNILYKIITGEERGLPLPESLEILGKETIIQRLQNRV